MPDDRVDDEQTETDTSTETETGGDRPIAGAALKSALDKERRARADLERQVKDLMREKQDREEAELSETERLKGVNARLQADIEERDRRDAVRNRESLVIRAAKDFADPDEVVAILAHKGELDGIESERDATSVLKQLAKDRPHLLRKQGDGMPDTSRLDQVLLDGQPAGGGKPGNAGAPQHIIPAEALAAMSGEEQQALKRNDPGLYWRSVEALNGISATSHTVV